MNMKITMDKTAKIVITSQKIWNIFFVFNRIVLKLLNLRLFYQNVWKRQHNL